MLDGFTQTASSNGACGAETRGRDAAVSLHNPLSRIDHRNLFEALKLSLFLVAYRPTCVCVWSELVYSYFSSFLSCL